MGFRLLAPDMCPMTMKQMAKTSEFLELEMPDAKEKILLPLFQLIQIETLQKLYCNTLKLLILTL